MKHLPSKQFKNQINFRNEKRIIDLIHPNGNEEKRRKIFKFPAQYKLDDRSNILYQKTQNSY